MPFPLAHPAAVLPLKRYCSRWLSFPALVIGSLVPDVGYVFADNSWNSGSHQLVGGLIFNLPVGILMLILFYGFRTTVARMLPTPYRQVLLPLCRRRRSVFLVLVLSLLVGIWTHLLLDSFTHNDGWLAEHVAVLQLPVLSFGGRTAKLCHVLWYVCSFAGAALLFIAFEKWKHSCTSDRAASAMKDATREGILLAVLVLPIALIHHLFRHPWVPMLTAAFYLVLVVGFFVKSLRRPALLRHRYKAEHTRYFDT